ncbi:protein Sur7p [[Candida] anglica]|uniref:Protein Sur7p n=1 Tax=[Candida] anglica TaxID=148631 RepID=A0ABP0ELS4_9ASCO
MKVALTFVNLVLLAGATLLLLLTVLSGSSNHRPLNEFYWLKANTSGIPGAPSFSAWTFWGVCERDDYSKCTNGPAYPISPVDNFSTTSDVPEKFIKNKDMFYYLTRFSFAFTLVGLGFAGVALIIDILGFCFTSIDKVVVAFVAISLFFTAGVAAFQTAACVLAKQAFNDANLSATVGLKSMAIIWAAVVCLLLSFFNTCAANISNSYKKHMDNVRSQKEYDSYSQPPPVTTTGPEGDESSFTRAAPEPELKEESSGGVRFFKIKRNAKVSDDESV